MYTYNGLFYVNRITCVLKNQRNENKHSRSQIIRMYMYGTFKRNVPFWHIGIISLTIRVQDSRYAGCHIGSTILNFEILIVDS